MSQQQFKSDWFLALDQGGHSTRALVFDAAGKIVCQAKQSVSLQIPEEDWAEQSADQLFDSLQIVLQALTTQLGDQVEKIKAAGLATQRSNVVCWDRFTGEALSPAISWQDRRAYQWLQSFKEKNSEVHAITGLQITAHYGASKLRWCLDNLPRVRQALQDGSLYWGPLASYLAHKLCSTEQHYIDPANASRTLLWNLSTLQWDQSLLQLFGVPRNALPHCQPSIADYGSFKMGSYSIPLTTMMGDQSAALLAYGEPREKTAYINMGTGAFIQMSTKNKVMHAAHLLSGIVMHDGDEGFYVLECTVNGAGSALSLVEQQLGISNQYAEQNFDDWLLRSNNPPLFLNGVSGIGSPYWRPHFDSRFIGEAQDWEKIVAVAESVLFLLQTNLEALKVEGFPCDDIFLTGGLTASDSYCQLLCNLSGVPVYRPLDCEATARGTAFVASGAKQAWPEVVTGTHFYPHQDDALQQRYTRWSNEMKKALAE